MATYNWQNIMENKKDYELKEIINSPEFRPEESVECAKKELEKRNLEKQKIEDKDENYEFPNKPENEKSKNILQKSAISLILFIAAFYLLFRWEISFILILVAVIFIHELGHYLAMRVFKYKDLSIYFIPLLGAMASGEKDQISQKQRAIVLFSGPIPGVVIGTILYYLGFIIENQLILRTANIFIFLNLFNLLPIYPLDGGQLIKNFYFNSREKLNIIFISISIILLVYLSFRFESYILLILPVFLINNIIGQIRLNKIKTELISSGYKLNKKYDELTNEEYWKIRDKLGEHLPSMRNIIEPKRYIISNREKLVINHIKTFFQKEPVRDIKLGGQIISILLWILSFILPIILIVLIYNGIIN